MRQHFKGYMKYTDTEFKDLWEKSLIVIDTNVLLYFYKYHSKKTAGQLLEVLRELSWQERLFIPHQVALEYFSNYEKNMNNQQEGYEKIKNDLTYLIENTKEESKTIIQRAISTSPHIKNVDFQFLVDNLDNSEKQLEEIIAEEIDEIPNTNEIHTTIVDLLKDRFGKPYTQETIDKIEEKGKERYDLKIPPGFKDAGKKTDFRYYGGIKYQQKYGDLIVWNQIIDKVKEFKTPMPVIFVTQENDEDWWHIVKGKTKGPHPTLIQEFFDETTQNFHMYNTGRFIEYASKHLDIEIAEDQLSELSAEIESITKAEEKVGAINYNKNITYKDYKVLNYKNLLDHSNVTIAGILSFLPIEEREQGKQLIKNALYEEGIIHYNEAVLQIMNRVMPNLENIAKDLHTELAIRGYVEEEKNVLNKLKSLPKDPVERGIELFNIISEIEYFFGGDELPFLN